MHRVMECLAVAGMTLGVAGILWFVTFPGDYPTWLQLVCYGAVLVGLSLLDYDLNG